MNNATKTAKLALHKTTIRSLSVRTRLRTGLSGSDPCDGGGGGGALPTDACGSGGGSIVLNDNGSGVTRTKNTNTCACGLV